MVAMVAQRFISAAGVAVVLGLSAGCSSSSSSSITSHTNPPVSATAVADRATPRVTGLTLGAARVVLRSRGFGFGTISHRSSAAAMGRIIGQNPPAGIFLKAGQTVDVAVSNGPPRP
jgi:PASTA domain